MPVITFESPIDITLRQARIIEDVASVTITSCQDFRDAKRFIATIWVEGSPFNKRAIVLWEGSAYDTALAAEGAFCHENADARLMAILTD